MASATATRPQPQVLPPTEPDEVELEIDGGAALATMTRSELETQIAFAIQRPRSIDAFRKRVESLACFNEQVALQMNYVLPRGEGITGPSVRFAEVVASSWGNNTAMSRVVGADDQWVRAQGVFYDCETNYKYGREVSRRITDKSGRRFNSDMIGVTGNAAASIAYRNAVLYGIPKGVWYDLYLKSREAAVGNVETLAKQRGEVLEWLKQAGIPMANVFNVLRIQGPHDIGPDQLVALKVMRRDIQSGERKIDELFGTAETGDIEAAMTHLGWNEGQKVSSRVAYKGRPQEHLAYLRQHIADREKSSVTTTGPAPTKQEPPQQQAQAQQQASIPPAEEVTTPPQTMQTQQPAQRPKASPPKNMNW